MQAARLHEMRYCGGSERELEKSRGGRKAKAKKCVRVCVTKVREGRAASKVVVWCVTFVGETETKGRAS